MSSLNSRQSSTIATKVSTNLIMEKHAFEWELKNFKSLITIQDEDFIRSLSMDFEAGSTIGKPSKWSFYLKKSTKLDTLGIYLKLVEMNKEEKLINAKFSASVKCRGVPCFKGSYPAQDFTVRKAGGHGLKKFIEKFTWLPDIFLEGNGSLVIHLRFKMHSHQTQSLNSAGVLIMSARNEKEIMDQLRDEFRKKLCEDFKTMLQHGQNTDFIIQAKDGKEFKVHRNVLAARSPVFNAMLQMNMKECLTGTVEVGDLSGPAMEILINFMYSGTFDEKKDLTRIVPEIIYAADKYSLPELKRLCDMILIKDCTIENAMELLKLARLHDLQNAIKDISKFVKLNIRAVLPTI